MTAPGVYDAIPEDVYHSDLTSLSVSGAKKLLAPSCPALFRYQQDNGRANKPAFDFGQAAHLHALGAGSPLQMVVADDWRTKAAREQREVAYATGAIPLLEKDWLQILGMVEALKAHPIASALLDPTKGKPEQSLYRIDPQTGLTLRARFDWLPDAVDGRLVIPDYKTARSAEPGAFARAAAAYGYHMQAAWYCDMAEALDLASDASFVFIVQEKHAPYLVSVVQLDDEAMDTGRRRNREAIDLYAECHRTGIWPSYSDGIELIGLPYWATDDPDMEMTA